MQIRCKSQGDDLLGKLPCDTDVAFLIADEGTRCEPVSARLVGFAVGEFADKFTDKSSALIGIGASAVQPKIQKRDAYRKRIADVDLVGAKPVWV